MVNVVDSHRAILFDIDNTIVDSNRAIQKIAAKEFGLTAPIELLRQKGAKRCYPSLKPRDHDILYWKSWAEPRKLEPMEGVNPSYLFTEVRRMGMIPGILSSSKGKPSNLLRWFELRAAIPDIFILMPNHSRLKVQMVVEGDEFVDDSVEQGEIFGRAGKRIVVVGESPDAEDTARLNSFKTVRWARNATEALRIIKDSRLEAPVISKM